MGWFSRGPSAAKLASRAPEGPVRDYLSTPAPEASTPASRLPALAVDVETTGLDPDKDALLSIGWVPIDGGEIVLSGARHHIIRGDREVGQSATFHGITDDALAAGAELAPVLDELLRALTGRVLVAHFARLEEGFTSRACERLHGVPLTFTTVDTLEVQRNVVVSPYLPDPPAGELRLPRSREFFGLPRYPNHNALTDALACAELYLAQCARLGDPSLKHLQR